MKRYFMLIREGKTMLETLRLNLCSPLVLSFGLGISLDC